MNRCRTYCLMNPLTGIWPACGDAISYRYASLNGDAGRNNQHFGARHVSATTPPRWEDYGHTVFTAPPPQCADATTTLHSPFSILNSSFSHTFSAKERDLETGLSYFGSRYYSSDLSIWLSVDPMSDKYPSLSPYVYCADNPVKLMDPDGRKIVFAKGTSKEFKKQFAAAIKNLNEHHLGGIASALEKSKITYTIAETTDLNNSFNSLTQTISWNPTMGLEVDDGAILSPTTALNHEFAHALTYDAAVKEGKLKEWYADCAEGSDPDYGSKNEKWVITRTEQKTAKALGEISEGQVTRKKHNGTPVTTENSTSNKKIVNQNDEKIQ